MSVRCVASYATEGGYLQKDESGESIQDSPIE